MFQLLTLTIPVSTEQPWLSQGCVRLREKDQPKGSGQAEEGSPETKQRLQREAGGTSRRLAWE